ncbi:MAG: 3-hydroxyisobutyrate dehydrogenase [Gaiellaceae bacterium]|jgi:3-hydroxyisobutyrate dehydrogenase/2-hydroxy-3-oxopropionate reductase|nr:3-hydroxyisobutyrate dehydrogenase [Gaiellaceae bacterium]
MADIAVVGLGAMGSRIARRLIDAGHDLVVWNRDAAKAEGFPQRAATPAEAAEQAGIVIIMVSDPAALAAVTEGIVAGAKAGSTVVQMSTVGVAAVRRLESELPDGVELLDAPVTGSLAEVEEGRLYIFAGGSGEVVARLSPILSTLGTVVPVGGIGAGSAAKLVANFSLISVLAALGEAFKLGRHLGLTNEALFDVLAATPLATQAERRRDAIESGSYPPRFALSLADKDAQLILDAAGDLDLRVARAVRSWYVDAMREGRGEEDNSALLATILGADATRLQ